MGLVISKRKYYTIKYKKLKKAISTVLAFLGVEDRELSVLLTDNEEIQNLNKEYRGIDSPTDVLSFEGEEGLGILGDVVISVERARHDFKRTIPYEDESFKLANLSFEHYLLWLVVHGILHNMGYDHNDKPSEAKMRSMEMLCLEKASQYL